MSKFETDSRPPIVVAIWFVDRFSLYCQLASMLLHRQLPPMHGIPIYTYTHDEIRHLIFEAIEHQGLTLERTRQIFPVCQPGVWAVMNRGPNRLLIS